MTNTNTTCIWNGKAFAWVTPAKAAKLIDEGKAQDAKDQSGGTFLTEKELKTRRGTIQRRDQRARAKAKDYDTRDMKAAP